MRKNNSWKKVKMVDKRYPLLKLDETMAILGRSEG